MIFNHLCKNHRQYPRSNRSRVQLSNLPLWCWSYPQHINDWIETGSPALRWSWCGIWCVMVQGRYARVCYGTWYRGGMAKYARVSPLIEGTTQWKGTQHSILSMKAFRADPPWYNSNASIKLIIRTLFSMDSSLMPWSLFSVKSVRWRCQIAWFVYWYSSGTIVRLSTCISNSLSSELWQFGKVVQLSALCIGTVVR